MVAAYPSICWVKYRSTPWTFPLSIAVITTKVCVIVISRLLPLHQLTDDEHDVSDRELDMEEGGDLSSLPWNEGASGSPTSPLPSSSRSASLAAPARAERSGRDTPASVDSIPLEWDHDYDLSRGLGSEPGEREGDEGEEFHRHASATLSGQRPLVLTRSS